MHSTIKYVSRIFVRIQSHQLVIHSDIVFFFFLYLGSFQEHSRFIGQQGKGEGIYLTPLYHFHPLHRHFNVSRAITAEIYCSYCSRAITGSVVQWLSLLHSFIQLSLNSGSAKVQNLLAAWRRLTMVRISVNGPGWK